MDEEAEATADEEAWRPGEGSDRARAGGGAGLPMSRGEGASRQCSGGGGAVASPHKGAGDRHPGGRSCSSVGTGGQQRCHDGKATILPRARTRRPRPPRSYRRRGRVPPRTRKRGDRCPPRTREAETAVPPWTRRRRGGGRVPPRMRIPEAIVPLRTREADAAILLRASEEVRRPGDGGGRTRAGGGAGPPTSGVGVLN